MKIGAGAWFVLICSVLTTNVAFAMDGVTGPQTHVMAAFEHLWTNGPITTGYSTAGIIVSDFDGDGQKEILSVADGAPYLLKKEGDNFKPKWYGELVKCSTIAAGDLDGDGRPEVCAGTDDGLIYISRGDSWEVVECFELPISIDQQYRQVSAVAVSDVDGDGKREIVAVTSSATFVFDGTSYSVKWKASDKGGTGLGVGDIDGDGRVELVVNAIPAHILDPVAKKEKFAWAGGFGDRMALGDTDGDGFPEIAYIKQQYEINCFLLDGDTMEVRWSKRVENPKSLVLEDLEGQGRADVIVGSEWWEYAIYVYRGADGTSLWGLPSPGSAWPNSIGCGDVDGDNVKEILLGAGRHSGGPDGILIADSRSRAYEYPMQSTYGPYSLASGDVDGDGATEILMMAQRGAGLSLSVFDAQTMALMWRLDNIWNSSDITNGLCVGQLDSDPALEILAVLGNGYGGATLKAFDGVTHSLEWESSTFSQGSPIATLIRNVDGDPVEEILIAMSDARVYVFNGASNAIQWMSEAPGYETMQDISLGDIDGGGITDLVVITNENVHVYDTATWDKTVILPIKGGGKGAIAHKQPGTPGQLILSLRDQRDYNCYIRCYEYSSPMHPAWEIPLGSYSTVSSVGVSDVDADGDEEFVVAGNKAESWTNSKESLLIIGSQVGSEGSWIEYESKEKWGTLNFSGISDIDRDGKSEMLLGGGTLCQIGKIVPNTQPCSLNCSATATPAEGPAPLFVVFAAMATGSGNCSDTPSYSWDFGDGATSSERTPGHSYAAPGSYTWTMVATVPGGASCTKSGAVTVTVPPCYIGCKGTASANSGPSPLAVSFTAEATLSYCAEQAAYSWSFGDGDTSGEQNPSHEYSVVGTYNWRVQITADDAMCSVSGVVIVSEPQCQVACSARAEPASGRAPLLVAFTSTVTPSHCTGNPSTVWKFGDGAMSELQNPSHKYMAPGRYAWTFSSRLGDAFCDKTGTIVVEPGIPGDCDGDGSVSIAELQKAINMFLGAVRPECGVDCDGDGAVSIGEVQKVVNGFLGLGGECDAPR